MLTLSGLYIYPIKSLGGISVNEATVTPRGLQYDRRWMLVDKSNRFLTQREYAEMALLQTAIGSDHLLVHHKDTPHLSISIPFAFPESTEKVQVQIWNDYCEAHLAGQEINEWFSDALDMSCRLVYMPDTTTRFVDRRYASNNNITSFSDDYPMLLIGQSSLDDLNARLAEALPMNRFRPNLVFTGCHPYEEDGMEEFTINGINFFGVKLCARCAVTTINQDSTLKGREPLKTLATYRQRNNKVYFGQNLLHTGSGKIKIGDHIEIKKLKSGF